MILARHAEATFWAGRQLERAEHTARMLDVASRDSMHFPDVRSPREWSLILEALGLDHDFANRVVDGETLVADGLTVPTFLFSDRTNPGSVAGSVAQMRENIRTVRDRVPVELWEEANRLHIDLDGSGIRLGSEPFERYSVVRRRCQAISGVIGEAMSRDEAFTFLVVGRMLERAVLTTRLVRCLVFRNEHALDEAAMLRMVSSLQAYRRGPGRGGDQVTLAFFLLTATDVPRTVLSCLRRAEARLHRLRPAAPGLEPALMVCGRVRANLEFGAVDRVLAERPEQLLLEIEAEMSNLSQAIADSAFDPAQAPPMQAQFIRPGQGE